MCVWLSLLFAWLQIAKIIGKRTKISKLIHPQVVFNIVDIHERVKQKLRITIEFGIKFLKQNQATRKVFTLSGTHTHVFCRLPKTTVQIPAFQKNKDAKVLQMQKCKKNVLAFGKQKVGRHFDFKDDYEEKIIQGKKGNRKMLPKSWKLVVE